ncbi:pilus assembly PilX family protein [Pseudoxanthomonas wuyuanensis]|uniref:Type IV pilus assembly protein PilX n=1 Tax=Pseudoxanthomonas wuyuanensis TaxID=1073196 RepID=A0A286DCS9_9GAMM|nr:PilX N-terminal domain-containing pilus assembly protein [Pseudoxanthomonas wuyuanensis]KAF1720768.1 PilX protein [Pseudoxanthomonas wuyuanensis]SOD56465.1 type IV pilus assembly protein PilX [Pseudoxanthomonas wuyuanensis]
MNPISSRLPAGSQRGASLVIVLILLLVMTLLGLAVLRSTLLEERMSANLFDRSLSFQAAESALRDAEAQIKAASLAGNIIGFNCSATGTVCPSVPINATTGTAGCTGSGQYCWSNAATIDQDLSPGVPQYYIEYMGQYTNEDDLKLGSSANAAQYGGTGGVPLQHFYRITARSQNPSGSDRSVVVLQSNVVVK